MNNFIKIICNKSIAIVGNADSINSGPCFGATIDTHDIVVKFNSGQNKNNEDELYRGKRCDLWVHGGCGRKILSWSKLFNKRRYSLYMWHECYCPYDIDNLTKFVVDVEWLNTLLLYWRNNFKCRPTTGFMFIKYLYQYIDIIKQISIYGFDHGESGTFSRKSSVPCILDGFNRIHNWALESEEFIKLVNHKKIKIN